MSKLKKISINDLEFHKLKGTIIDCAINRIRDRQRVLSFIKNGLSVITDDCCSQTRVILDLIGWDYLDENEKLFKEESVKAAAQIHVTLHENGYFYDLDSLPDGLDFSELIKGIFYNCMCSNE